MDEIESIENQIKKIDSIDKQIENTDKNLDLIYERISEYMPTDVPFQLIKDKQELIKNKQELIRNKQALINKQELIRNKQALIAKLIGLKGHRDRLQKGRDIPPLLPYFVNRDYQELKLGEALIKLFNNPSPKPLLCIIHGDQFQCHDKFFESLIKVSLPKIIKRNTNITTSDEDKEFIGEYELKWPPRITIIEELKNMLEYNLGKRVLDYGLASKEDINNHLSSIGPVVIHTHLLTTDLQKNSSKIIENFFEFWQDWPELNPNQCLIICLFIKYQVKQKSHNYFQKLWNLIFKNLLRKNFGFESGNSSIQKSIEDLSSSNFTKFDKIIGVVLPELQGVSQTEVESWARSQEVKNYWDEENIQYLIHTIEDMFEKWEKDKASNTMPMSHLAQNLSDILQGKITIKGDIV